MERKEDKDLRLERLMVEHYKTLYRIVSSRIYNTQNIQETVQNAVVMFTEKYYKEQYYKRLSDEEMKRILYVITYRRTSNFLRDEGRRSKHIDIYERELTSPSLEDEVFAKIDIQIICECIAELPEKYRTYFYYEIESELSQREIADLLGVKPDTLSSIASRARKLLKEACEARDVEVGKLGKRKK